MARLHQIGPIINSVTNGMEVDVFSGVSVNTSIIRNGVRSFRINPTNSFGYIAHQIVSSTTGSPIFLRFYLYIASFPTSITSTPGVATFTSGTSDYGSVLKLDGSGNMGLYDYDDNLVGSTATVSTGQWYLIEVTQSNSNGNMSWKLNGTQIGSGSGTNINIDSVAIGVAPERYGGASSSHNCSCDLYISDIAINDSTGTVQNSFPGEGKIGGAFPTGNGDNHAWSTNVGGTAGTTNNYTRENENPPDDATSYNGEKTLNNIDDYSITSPSNMGSSDTVSVIMLFVRYAGALSSSVSSFKLRYKKVSGGTITSGSVITPNSTSWKMNSNSSPALSSLIAYTDPDGGAITKASIDSSQIGQIISTSSTNSAYITNLVMSVDYITVTPSSSIKTINGLAKASVKTVNGVAIASVKSINGLS